MVQRQILLHMAQLKTILFLGRTDPDTGYDYCVHLCHKNNWKLIVAGGDRVDASQLIKNVDAVFTTGYLGIVEAFVAGKPVLVYADNPLKKDYLAMHSMSKYFVYSGNIPKKLALEPQAWARQQTWDKVTDLYEQLWRR